VLKIAAEKDEKGFQSRSNLSPDAGAAPGLSSSPG
jgi:hypothetical protein